MSTEFCLLTAKLILDMLALFVIVQIIHQIVSLFYKKFIPSTSLNGHSKVLLMEFSEYCNEYASGLHQTQSYNSDAVDKAEVRIDDR